MQQIILMTAGQSAVEIKYERSERYLNRSFVFLQLRGLRIKIYIQKVLCAVFISIYLAVLKFF